MFTLFTSYYLLCFYDSARKLLSIPFLVCLFSSGSFGFVHKESIYIYKYICICLLLVEVYFGKLVTATLLTVTDTQIFYYFIDFTTYKTPYQKFVCHNN